MKEKVKRRSLLAGSAALLATALTSEASAEVIGDSDPDLMKISECLNQDKTRGETLSELQKYCALLACVTAQALPEAAEQFTTNALKAGLDPIAIKEIVYQCAPYVGLGKVEATLRGVNRALTSAGVKLPLPSQTTVTDADRRQKGEETVLQLNGARMKDILAQVPKDEYDLRINDLYDFCFGDFYTRKGLSLKDRELVVFAAIATLGGCEPQLRSHIGANLREGTTKAQLTDALRVMLPNLGFPRTLNAMNQVSQVSKGQK